MSEARDEDVYEYLTWERYSAGVYKSAGGRFKIARKGPKNWHLIDNVTGKEMRFDLLNDAQFRADWIVNNAKGTQ